MAALESFPGNRVSTTIEVLDVCIRNSSYTNSVNNVIDDARMARVLASFHNLKQLSVDWGWGCVFGRSGVADLKALALGCSSLTDIHMRLTSGGMWCLGVHCPNLEICGSWHTVADSITVFDDLRTVFPKIEWVAIDHGN